MRTSRFLPAALLAVSLLGLAAALPGASGSEARQAPQPEIPLPNREGTFKFAVLGDFGTGDREQYQLGEQMAKVHERFPFELVITVGDNIYGGERPQDMKKKFEEPVQGRSSSKGVKFYASLGNHDDREQRVYALFNMDGKTYYTFKAPKQSVRFFALETDYLTPAQTAWFEKELASAGDDWKIPYFHHPLYSSGDRHGSDSDLRTVLEPLFLNDGVSVVFAGHDHFYERIKPQKGITHFVIGSGGQLRRGDIDKSTGLTAVRLRYRSGVSRRRNQRRSALLQRHLQDRGRHRLRRHRAAETGIGSSTFFASRGALSVQSCSNTAIIFFAALLSCTMTPTSRRPSSSSLRRLWLPMKKVVPSRTMARTCRRRPASGRAATPSRPLSILPMTRISTPALRRSASSAQRHTVGDLDVVDEQLLCAPWR